MSRVLDVKNNPCLKEHMQSLQCLELNSFDSKNCEVAFENYKECKRFWSHVQNERRRKNIEPFLPDPSEREEIKKSYMKKKVFKVFEVQRI